MDIDIYEHQGAHAALMQFSGIEAEPIGCVWNIMLKYNLPIMLKLDFLYLSVNCLIIYAQVSLQYYKGSFHQDLAVVRNMLMYDNILRCNRQIFALCN